MSLSNTVEHEQKLEQLRQTMSEREHELERLQRTLAEQETALSYLKHEVSQREQALGTLQQSLELQDDTLIALKQAITEQENALETLRVVQQSELLLEDEDDRDPDYKIALALTLSNAAYEALLVVDAETRVIASNTSAETLFDTPQPIGQLLTDVTGLPELEMLVVDALANEEESYEEQLTFNKHFYRVRTQVIRRGGNLFIGMALQDVSELVRLNRARRDMVANISHELRTPIANIRLIIDSLFHEQDKPKRKQSTSALRAIARETDSLLWLVQELLDLSMIESGQAILRMIETPLTDIVAEAIERVEDQSEAKEIDIINETPAEIQVLADSDQARRVLINLIHNAIKWSPPSEKIRVRAEASGDEVTISVLDNGPGVPEEFRERIFERFYQVDPSRSVGEGTGLGLAICRHIVEAHGGRIWVENNEEGKDGKGGCFKFTLPAADEVEE